MKTSSHIETLSHDDLVEMVKRLLRENERYRQALANPRRLKSVRTVLDQAPPLETAKTQMLDGYAYCARCGQAWCLEAGEPPYSCNFCANRSEKELRYTGKASWLRNDREAEQTQQTLF